MGSKNKNNKNRSKTSAGAGDSARNDKKLIDDPRFSKLHYDPRFQKAPKHKAKVSIDSRFDRMFTDKQFASSSAPIDKRGKPKKQSENALRRYYHLEEDKGEEKEVMKKKLRVKEEDSSADSSSESSESESESELGSSDSSAAADSVTDSDYEEDGVEMSGDEASDEVENVPLIEKETHRLAVVNMDWSQVKAVDLLVMLSSCLPKGGQIKSVKVYPSEFGLKRMEEEAVRGPVALFQDDKEKDEDDDSENDDEDDDSENDDEEEIDTEKLRAYEKSRLRYYYAVVECDSIATADYLYKACDGLEFERSSNVLDLRFIPDTMEFQHPPRDVATEAPADYEGLDFHTRALQHSNTVLSWDDDEPHRVKTLGRKFNEKQLAELELKEFLASDESESDEDGNENGDPCDKRKKKAESYRALVQSGDGSEEEEDEGQDMEVTFNTGLEDLSKKILEQKDKGSETVWEAYLRKRKEKSKAKKFRSKHSSDDDSDESDQEPLDQTDDFFEEEPSAKRSKKVAQGKRKREEKRLLEEKEEKEAERSRAELELLLADEKDTDKKLKGYKIKQKKTKGKNGKEAFDEVKVPTAELDDPRFAALFSNPGFALDPTDPQFKRTATYIRQAAQRQHKSQEELVEPIEPPGQSSYGFSSKEDKHSVGTSRKEKLELSSIVKSLKMKSQQLSMSSSIEMKKDSNGSNLKKKKEKLPNSDRAIKKIKV